MIPTGNRIFSSSDFGAVIRTRRKGLSMTQQELADSIGVARRVIGELERGKQSVQLQIALDAMSALGLNLYAEER